MNLTTPRWTQDRLTNESDYIPSVPEFDPQMKVVCEDGTIYLAGYRKGDKTRTKLNYFSDEVRKPMMLIRISLKKGEERRRANKKNHSK